MILSAARARLHAASRSRTQLPCRGRRPTAASRRQAATARRVEDELRDLDRVERCALVQVVAGEEEDEPVADGRIAADAADEHVVGLRPRRAASASPASRTHGRPPSSSCACSGESGSSRLDPDRFRMADQTGTRTHVALIGSSGSSRILRVSARIFDSSSDSSPSKSQSMREVVLARRLARSSLHPLRAGAGDRLVGRDAHAREAGGVVQRLQHAGERDRAAVRVRDDAVVLERAGAVHLGHDERDAGSSR